MSEKEQEAVIRDISAYFGCSSADPVYKCLRNAQADSIAYHSVNFTFFKFPFKPVADNDFFSYDSVINESYALSKR